jgi:hypothetical protein
MCFHRKEEIMHDDTQRINTLIGLGDAGYRLVPRALETANSIGIGKTILAGGICDLERLHRGDEPLPLENGTDLSPALQSINHAQADESTEPAITKLAHAMNDTVADTYIHKHGGNITFIVSLRVLPLVYEPIRRLKRRMPNHNVAIVTVLPPTPQQGKTLETELRTVLAQAPQDHIATFVIDPDAGAAMKNGVDAQEKTVMLSLLELCIAPLVDEHNPTFKYVSEELVKHGRLSGIAYASLHVATGKEAVLSRVAKRFYPKWGERGVGDLGDLLTQAQDCTTNAVVDKDDTCCASPEKVDTQKPFFLLYTVPLMPTDERWREFAQAMKRYLKQNYPNATSILCRSNAVAAPGNVDGYRVGVTVFYPLTLAADVPDIDAGHNVRIDLIEEETQSQSTRTNGRKRIGSPARD